MQPFTQAQVLRMYTKLSATCCDNGREGNFPPSADYYYCLVSGIGFHPSTHCGYNIAPDHPYSLTPNIEYR